MTTDWNDLTEAERTAWVKLCKDNVNTELRGKSFIDLLAEAETRFNDKFHVKQPVKQ